MTAAEGSAAFLKTFKYETLRDLSLEQHFTQAATHYVYMLETGEARHLVPCIVHLAMAQRTFQSLEETFKTRMSPAARSNARRTYLANGVGQQLPYTEENDFFLHAWYAINFTSQKDNGVTYSKYLPEAHKRHKDGEAGIEQIRTAKTFGALDDGILKVVYSARPFATFGSKLGTGFDENLARRAFLELVRGSVLRLTLQAVPPKGRPKHGDAPIRGIEGQ